MTIEGAAFRLGEVRTADLRAAVGDDLYFHVNSVQIFALGTPGSRPSLSVVQLCDMPGGRGEHRGMRCARCLRPRYVLLTDGGGGFACAPCLRRRTRRQLEQGVVGYDRLGGRQHDRLLRLLKKQGLTAAGRRLAGTLVRELVDGDRKELRAVERLVNAKLNR